MALNLKEHKRYKKDSKYNEWIHSGCFHVICGACVLKVDRNDINIPSSFKCPLCLKTARGCLLGNNMPSHLKQLFHPEPWLDDVNNLKIIQYQTKQRERIMEYIHRKKRVNDEIENHIKRIADDCKRRYYELRDATIERKHLERRVRMIKQQQLKAELETQQNQAPKSSINSLSTSTTLEPDYRSIRPTTRTPAPVYRPLISESRMPCPNNQSILSFSSIICNNSFQL